MCRYYGKLLKALKRNMQWNFIKQQKIIYFYSLVNTQYDEAF